MTTVTRRDSRARAKVCRTCRYFRRLHPIAWCHKQGREVAEKMAGCEIWRRREKAC